MEAAEARGVPVVELKGGEEVAVGGIVFRVLGDPKLSGDDESRDELAAENLRNESSLVISLRMEEVTFLFTGDVEEVGQGRLIDAGAVARAEVLKVPHHGGFAENTDLFLKAVGPRVAVISVKTPNEYGHPAAGTLEVLRRLGCRVFRTDQSGDIVVEVRGGRVMVREERPSR